MRFPEYLQYIVSSESLTLDDLAKMTGLDRSDLSKAIRGKRSVGSKVMEQIVSGLAEQYQEYAVQCWLSDQIPDGLKHFVKIQLATNDSKLQEAPNVRTLEGALLVLERQAEISASLRVVIMNLAAAFGHQG